jgi:predicted phosphodiesterase
VGDTQRVMPIEQLVLGRDTNDVGRTAVASKVLSGNPVAIVHLGDVVGTVGSARDWARFDRDYSPQVLRAKRLLVCRGNHDCGGLLMGTPRQFAARYPESIGRLRIVDIDFVRLLLLDTNVAALSQSQWEQQRTEYGEALRLAESDAAIRHLLVCGHHPPLTNGRWHRANRAIYDAFVSAFLACTKARAFFSGHVHGYERFALGNCMFIVSGGGGGARVPHLHGVHQRHVAAVDLPDPHPLHYLQLEASAERVRIVARGHDQAIDGWRELDACEFTIV